MKPEQKTWVSIIVALFVGLGLYYTGSSVLRQVLEAVHHDDSMGIFLSVLRFIFMIIFVGILGGLLLRIFGGATYSDHRMNQIALKRVVDEFPTDGFSSAVSAPELLNEYEAISTDELIAAYHAIEGNENPERLSAIKTVILKRRAAIQE